MLIVAIAALAMVGCCTEGKFSSEVELPKLDALVIKSEGSTIYGQVLVPSAKFARPRPCVIFCHGFAGFTRWDDVAHDLCRAGIAIVIPHHRGAWGSEGEYTVTGCIRDAENLARWATGADFAAKYQTDTNAVYLVGHSMGGNSVVNAAARMGGVKGVALIAPCDIGFMSEQMKRDELTRFLIGEGLHVLHRASDEAVVDDIERNAESMRFSRAAQSLAGVGVFLATGEYDAVVPTKPLDMFWAALPNDGARRIRKSYRATHSLMGCRRALARDLVEFVQFPLGNICR
jgi:pimeloyl-ACP methyl ester carboxylesterase